MVYLRERLFPSGKSGSVEWGQTQLADNERMEPQVRCRRCNLSISSLQQRIAIQGSMEHTFPNPQGNIFNIICFRNCHGLIPVGQPSLDFTWFAGFSWRVVVCQQCLSHLGWFYIAADSAYFYGLIAAQIIA